MGRFSFVCRDPIISEASIPEYAIFPVNAFAKPSLKDRAYRKASVPDYQHLEAIAAIPRP